MLTPTDAALDEARKEAVDAIKAAFTESETCLSDQMALRVVEALKRYFHMKDRVLGEASSSEESPENL